MRILSQSEFDRLGLEPDVPPDSLNQYFPVNLKIHRLREGEAPMDDEYVLENDAVKKVFDRVERSIDARRAWKITKKKDYTSRDEVINELRWWSVKFGEGGERNDTRSKTVFFPVARLLFAPQLQPLGIEPVPGFLYFVVEFDSTNQSWADFNCTGSYLVSDQSYLGTLREYRDMLRDRKDIEERIQSQIDNVRSTKKKITGGKKARIKELEDQLADLPELELPKFYGPVFDIAHCTNSRVLRKHKYEDGLQYLLETPFEFPPGFVRETAMVLKERWAATSKLVDRFCDLVFSKRTIEKGKDPGEKNLLKEQQDGPFCELTLNTFPNGESRLQGPDLWWRYSDDPWLVQTVLLARLIGEDVWQYALGNLEQNMESTIDYLDLDD